MRKRRNKKRVKNKIIKTGGTEQRTGKVKEIEKKKKKGGKKGKEIKRTAR